MIHRDPRCDNDDCDYDGTGTWVHVEKCGADAKPMPQVDLTNVRKGSFLEFLLTGGKVDKAGS